MHKLLLSLFFLLLAFPVHSQENEEEDTVTQEPSASEQTSSSEETVTTEQKGQSESFIPSEIISEDLSVPFPVDI